MKPHLAARLASLATLLVFPACGAFFPRYSTVVRDVPPGLAQSGELTAPPDTAHRLSPVSADLPRLNREGQEWDGDGPPDPYVIVYRNGAEVYRSRVIANTLHPEWDPARDFADLTIADRDELRVELRDDDGMGSYLVGAVTVHGVPMEARNGGIWRVRLEGGTEVVLRSVPVPPRLGMGVTFDYHDDGLGVVSVEPAGPANSAGLRAGDRIVSIGGRPVSVLGEVGARQAMDRGSMEDVTLQVARGTGTVELTVRRDALYPTH